MVVSRFTLHILLLFFLLVLSGCLQDDRSPAACDHELSQALDAGDWDTALALAERRSCRRAMSEAERQLDRGAALAGRGGYDLTDMVGVVLSDAEQDERAELRFIRLLGQLGVSPGALRDLDLSLQAHQQAVSGEADLSPETLLQQACRSENRDNLSEAQQDACFLVGLFAHARFAKAMVLILGDDLNAWLGEDELSCTSDRNSSGVADGAEITACALAALARPDADGATCQPGSSERGAVRWEPVWGNERIGFRIDGETFARLRGIRVVVEPGKQCSGHDPRVRYRMLRPSGQRDASLVVADGACRQEVTRSCETVDPDSGCWPCPVPRADGSDTLTISNTLLSPLNREAELMLFVLPGVEEERIRDRLERSRQRMCEPAEGTSSACGRREDGATEVRQGALEAYFRR